MGDDAHRRPPGAWWRAGLAAAALLVVLVAISMCNSPKGFLGTDTGGKVATLRVMERDDTLVPDVGYWAQRWDPDGSLHPLYYTNRFDDRWVNVTTLPALLAAYPLWRVAGYRGVLLLPMLGTIAAAFAARALARRLDADRATQWLAFWVVGLASPLTIYALDFWEHSLGVAVVAWGIVALADALRGRRPVVMAALAGLAFGVAATMRTEALVYGAVATALAAVVMLRRGSVRRAVVVGAVVAAALVVPLLGNAALERGLLGHGLRAERAAGTVTASAARGAGRGTEAAVTSFGLKPSTDGAVLATGAFAALLIALAWAEARRAQARRIAAVALALAAVLYVARFSEGTGFVPGLFAATPFAAVGVVGAWRSRPAALVALAAIVALPLVWRFQFLGGALPQWAGRYVLTSGLLLLVAGVVASRSRPTWFVAAVVALSAAVTAFGLAWTSVRTHDIARTGAALAARPEPVLVSTVGHLFREAGAYYTPDRRWLTAVDPTEVDAAAKIVEAAGFDRFGLVRLGTTTAAPPVAGFRPVGDSTVRFFSGIDLDVVTYARR